MFMGSMYLWGRSTQEMGGDVVIGCSIYGVVVGPYTPILWYYALKLGLS